jgi:outer membrane protein OmpA-like peptidoglycan-associated protein
MILKQEDDMKNSKHGMNRWTLLAGFAIGAMGLPFSYAGQYDNSVLDSVTAKEFVQLLTVDAEMEKAFVRTQMPRAGDNRCSLAGGRPSSIALSKLRVVGGDNASQTALQVPVDPNETLGTQVPYYGNRLATVHLAVRFALDSDKLSKGDANLLTELAKALSGPELVKGRFAVVGHTDATGPNRRNLELSCARAIAVRNFLIDKGVEPSRLTPYGFGSDSPLLRVDVRSTVNRRVEISRSE